MPSQVLHKIITPDFFIIINYFKDFDEDREALKDLNDMMHHDNLSKEDTKYVLEMIAAIKQGANKNKKKELKSMRVVGVFLFHLFIHYSN